MGLPGVTSIVDRSVGLATVGDVEQGLELFDGTPNRSSLQASSDWVEGVVRDYSTSLKLRWRRNC